MGSEDTHVQVPSPRRETKPHGRVDPAVMRDVSLPQQVKLLYALLATYADGVTRECWPSRNRIVTESGMSRGAFDAALRCAESVGLVETRAEFMRDGQRCDEGGPGAERTSNRYVLHDFGTGFKVGQGPGRKLPYGYGVRTAVVPTSAQPLGGGGTADVQEQDHLTQPSSTHAMTPPGEDAASVAAKSRPKVKLFRPKRWTELDSETAAQEACAYVARAFRAVGFRPTDRALSALGQSIKRWDDDGMDRTKMWVNVRREVDKFGLLGQYEDWLAPLPPRLSVVR